MGKASRRRLSNKEHKDVMQQIDAAKLWNMVLFNSRLELRKSTAENKTWNRALYNAHRGDFDGYSHLKLDGDEWLNIYDSHKQTLSDLIGKFEDPHPADEVYS